MATMKCYCGRPLHYSDKELQAMVEDMCTIKGEFIRVTVNGRIFLAPRHYIALHGLKGTEIHKLGFQEVTGEAHA